MVGEVRETLPLITIFDAEPSGINCVSIVLNWNIFNYAILISRYKRVVLGAQQIPL